MVKGKVRVKRHFHFFHISLFPDNFSLSLLLTTSHPQVISPSNIEAEYAECKEETWQILDKGINQLLSFSLWVTSSQSKSAVSFSQIWEEVDKLVELWSLFLCPFPLFFIFFLKVLHLAQIKGKRDFWHCSWVNNRETKAVNGLLLVASVTLLLPLCSCSLEEQLVWKAVLLSALF